jgi:hypothetical protein
MTNFNSIGEAHITRLTEDKLSNFVFVLDTNKQELVRFDTQLMQDPTMEKEGYQQGTLYQYEVREYVLEKWGRNCGWCGVENVPLEVEHIQPRSRGGSNRPP